MTATPATTTEIKTGLQREFPGWSMIVTRDTGRWWACRYPPPEGWRGEQVVTELDADTPDGLRAKLRDQP